MIVDFYVIQYQLLANFKIKRLIKINASELSFIKNIRLPERKYLNMNVKFKIKYTIQITFHVNPPLGFIIHPLELPPSCYTAESVTAQTTVNVQNCYGATVHPHMLL